MDTPHPTPPVLLLAADELDGFEGISGWRLHHGFDLGDGPWDRSPDRLLCAGVVDAVSAPDALAALTRGAGLAITIDVHGSQRHRFLEDLHKLSAPVAYEPTDETITPLLSPVQTALLEALADGATVTAAATARHLSRRTANRLLADARTRLGAETNAAAVSRWAAVRPDR